jgi:hypothetical protein
MGFTCRHRILPRIASHIGILGGILSQNKRFGFRDGCAILWSWKMEVPIAESSACLPSVEEPVAPRKKLQQKLVKSTGGVILGRKYRRAMKALILGLAMLMLNSVTTRSEADSRLFEMRVYYAAPGKLDALNARFRDHTLKLFEKHGIANLGYWVPQENPENKLVYFVSFPNEEARTASFKAFGADPEWQAAVKSSEANGKLVTKVDSIFFKAADFSPAIAPAKEAAPRIFELRTYKASAGNLGKLQARFRDHTVALFKKHGMTSLGYWTPVKKEQGAEDTLVYILAHRSRESEDAAFKAFRADPDWIAAKKASETNGALTTKVESVLMDPTDYSPTR